jgi:HEPN domain-containing protein
MHPLVEQLTHLKDSEVEQKISELTRKYFAASNPDIRQQIIMILETYKEEQAKRQRVAYEKMMQSRDKGLDKLININ